MDMATGGNDSGVETGNESNDLDDITVNVINEMGDPVPLAQSPSVSGDYNDNDNDNERDGRDVPPPPPTSPNICGTGDSSDLFPDLPAHVNGMGGLGLGLEYNCSDSLDGMQGDPAEDCELEEEEEGAEMDEDPEEEDSNSTGHGSYSTSPPFEFPAGNSSTPYLGEEGVFQRSWSFSGGGAPQASPGGFLGQSPFQSGCPSSPVSPSPSSNSGGNNCRALVKFEFPELPKLVCEFAEQPSPCLRSFFEVGDHYRRQDGPNGSGYPTLNPAPSTNDCRTLIPYEQHDLNQKFRMDARIRHTRVRNKLYDNWSNLRKEYNERRLRTATSGGNHLMVQRLLGTGVDPNSCDELGRTPLHIAACKGYCDVVNLLLSFGANPNQKDSIGNTPLHLSACTNHFDVVTCLLRAGTDVSTLDNNGRNPLQLAQSKLKLIMQTSKSDTEDAVRVKKEVQQIIEMMTEYLQKKGQDVEAELLNEFASRLTLSQTPQEVDDLLANLSSLSITSQGHNAGNACSRSRAMTNPVKTPPRNPYLIPHLNPSLARPRSASFSHPPSANAATSSSLAQSGSIIKPGLLSRSQTVHEEQQLLMSQCNKD